MCVMNSMIELNHAPPPPSETQARVVREEIEALFVMRRGRDRNASTSLPEVRIGYFYVTKLNTR